MNRGYAERVVSSLEQMTELAGELVQLGYTKFGLIGELGAGKTHFTKGVALALGLDPDQVHSPTYVYFHEYKSTPDGPVVKPLLHVDMYRMVDSFQIIKIWLEEKLLEYEYMCIERPRLNWMDIQDLVIVTIDIVDDQTRRVQVRSIQH